jgi:hypothetical protein
VAINENLLFNYYKNKYFNSNKILPSFGVLRFVLALLIAGFLAFDAPK